MKEDDVSVLDLRHQIFESGLCGAVGFPILAAHSADECVFHYSVHVLVAVDVWRTEKPWTYSCIFLDEVVCASYLVLHFLCRQLGHE